MFENADSIRPAPENVVAIAGIALLWSGLVWWVLQYSHVRWLAIANAVLMGVLVLAAWRAKVARQLVVRGDTIFYESGFGPARPLVTAGDGSRIVRVRDPRLPIMVDLWLDVDGRSRFRTSERQWDVSGLNALWARVGLVAPEHPENVSLEVANQRYPRAAPRWQSVLPGPHERAHTLNVRTIRPVRQQLRMAVLDDGQSVSYRDEFGRVRTVLARGETGRVVGVTARVMGRRLRKQLWLDEAGRCRMHLEESAWDIEALEACRRRYGLPYEELTEPRSLSELNREFPGVNATTPLQAVLVAAGVFPAVFLILIVFDLLTR